MPEYKLFLYGDFLGAIHHDRKMAATDINRLRMKIIRNAEDIWGHIYNRSPGRLVCEVYCNGKEMGMLTVSIDPKSLPLWSTSRTSKRVHIVDSRTGKLGESFPRF